MSWPLDRLSGALRHRGKRARTLLWADGGVHDLADGRHHASFDGWCAEHAGSACEIRVMGDALLDLLPGPGTPVQPATQRLQWAQRVLAHYHGAQAAGWPLVAWPAASGHALGVSAWRAADVASVQAGASRHGVAVRGVLPLWPALLSRLLRARPALARAPVALAVWVEGACASIATLHNGRLAGLQRRRLPGAAGADADAAAAANTDADADADEGGISGGSGKGLVSRPGSDTPHAEDTPATLQRLVDETLQGAAWPVATLWLGPDAPAAGRCPRLDLAVVLPLSGLAACLTTPARWWAFRAESPGLDFTRPLPQPVWWAWAACAGSLALLATAALEARAAHGLRAAARALAPLQAAPAPALRSARANAPLASPGMAAVSSVWGAQAAYPWLEVLQAGERASLPGVNWQLLEHETGGELRLRGRSAKPGQARDVAAALRRAGLWNEVWVVRQELPDESEADRGEHFEIVARGGQGRP